MEKLSILVLGFVALVAIIGLIMHVSASTTGNAAWYYPNNPLAQAQNLCKEDCASHYSIDSSSYQFCLRNCMPTR